MTAERSIGYIGIAILFVNIFPFGNWFVTFVDVVLAVCLILVATYISWKNRVRRMGRSIHGHITIPDIVDRMHDHSAPRATPQVESIAIDIELPGVTKQSRRKGSARKITVRDIEEADQIATQSFEQTSEFVFDHDEPLVDTNPEISSALDPDQNSDTAEPENRTATPPNA